MATIIHIAEMYRDILRCAPDPYLILDKNLIIWDASNAYLSATMQKRANVINKNLFDVYPTSPHDIISKSHELLCKSVKKAIATKKPDIMPVQKYDLLNQEADEKGYYLKYWRVINTPVVDSYGNVQFIIHRAEDITENILQSQNTKKTKALNKELLRSNLGLITQNDIAHHLNISLQEDLLAKNRFLASFCHELRTPLNAIIGFSDVLLKEMSGKLTKEQKEYISMIKSNGDRLAKLVGNLADVSDLEKKENIHFSEVNCYDLVKQVLDYMNPYATAKGLTIKFISASDEYLINTAPKCLKQMLMNLIDNAIKYTFFGSITITLDKTRIDNKRNVIIDIIDTGIGIKDEDKRHLFELFPKGDNKNEALEGLGVGLYASKKIADKINAEILVYSEFGKGSRFKVIQRDNP